MCAKVIVLDPTVEYGTLEAFTPDELLAELGIQMTDEDAPEDMDGWRATCFCCSDPTRAMLAAGYHAVPEHEDAVVWGDYVFAR
jgi:hypothetical protein